MTFVVRICGRPAVEGFGERISSSGWAVGCGLLIMVVIAKSVSSKVSKGIAILIPLRGATELGECLKMICTASPPSGARAIGSARDRQRAQ